MDQPHPEGLRSLEFDPVDNVNNVGRIHEGTFTPIRGSPEILMCSVLTPHH